MTEEVYTEFVQDHLDEIVDKVLELDKFDHSDIARMKYELTHGIVLRKKMPVVPIDEVKSLLVGYVAIRFIEERLDYVF
jgi:hypothetical protein